MEGVRTVILASVSSLRSSGPPSLNWLFLVESVVIIILILFYFFYLNQLLALILSCILRIWLWKSRNAYFELDALQFSLVGGRIDFSGLRYISRNQSLRVGHGTITWRYWLRRVKSEEAKLSEANLPSRLTISIQGGEWFLYNRTPSYDDILMKMGVVDPLSTSTSTPTTTGLSNHTDEKGHSHSEKETLSTSDPSNNPTMSSSLPSTPPLPAPLPLQDSTLTKSTTDWLREALPIEIKCEGGSIIMGNRSTSCILIAGFESVKGSYAAVKSRSKFDEYKQVYRFTFSQPKIVYRINPDYEGPLASHGERVIEKLLSNPSFILNEFLQRPSLYGSIHAFRHLLRKIPVFHSSKSKHPSPTTNPSKSGSPSSKTPTPASHWSGLSRYQTSLSSSSSTNADNSTPTPAHRKEYAKVMTLLTSPELEMTYYCDTAGRVPEVAECVTGLRGLEVGDVGNGDLSPEWGVDLVVRGGVITYGPWADRQRSELQQVFTPPTFFNLTETTLLKPGDERMHTALKVFVEFSEGATLRIPTREPSKDWKYDGLDPGSLTTETVRPYGWLDVTLGPNSTMSYVMPMVATSQGYDTLVECHLDEMSVSSSVNYATFLRAETCRIHGGLPSPLIWDDLRTWTIGVTMAKPDISLLRDHITLFTDVAKDWTSGPPGDYEHFVPYNYVFDLNLSDLVLRLFVNDHNIINNPSTFEDNTLLICKTPKLISSVTIPSNAYRMECSTIGFTSSATNLALSMTLPDWNTHNTFLTDNTRTFGTTPELNVEGTYRFYASAHPDHVERLKIAVDCRDVVFKTMGWMIRHLFNLRDNYFGTFTHFVTLEEYRHRHERNLQGDPLELKFRPGSTDVFEVAVTLQLNNGLHIFPQELFDCQSAVVLVLPQMQVDLRNHDYFMEMSLNFDPFKIIQTFDCASLLQQNFSTILELPDSIRVQGLEVTANRLFGPQPRTATYICIWSFHLGAVVGSIPPNFLQSISRVVSSLAINFTDQDNSLPPDFVIALDPDATFVTLNARSIDLAVRGQGTAVQLALPDGLKVRFDDLATTPFLKHISIEVPVFYLRFLAPLFGRAAPWMEVASLDADFSVVIGLTATGWEERKRAQLKFIQSQDETRRCPFLYGGGSGVSSHIGSLFIPALSSPLRNDSNDFHSGAGRSGEPANPDYVRPHISLEDDSSSEDSDSDSNDSYSEDSETSKDDYQTLYTQLPGRGSGRSEEGNRFSAYGAILRLCKRAPEASLLDRPTFRRLPLASDIISPPVLPRTIDSAEQRLNGFGDPPSRGPTSRSSIDITSRKPIKIVLTPVAVQVGGDVLDNMPVDTDLERCLDDLFADYIGSRNASRPIRYSTAEIKLAIPSIEIESIQDVLRPEDTISIKGQTRDNRSTILCTVRLTLQDVSLSLLTTEDGYGAPESPAITFPAIVVERKLAASASSTRLEVFHPPISSTSESTSRRNHTLPSSSAGQRPTALDLKIGSCDARLDFSPLKASLALHGGKARLDFVDEAAELVIGSLWSWRVIHSVTGPLARRATESALLSRRLVWSVVEASNHSSITTFPTFLNRVSYLVGSSANLRGDDGWKLLHHLRHCLRVAKDDIEHVIDSTHDWPSSLDLLADIVEILSRWRSWEIDAQDLTRAHFLSTLFDQPAISQQLAPPVTAARLAWDIPFQVEWRAGRFEAFLSDGSRSENGLALGPLEAFVSSSGTTHTSTPLKLRGRVTLHAIEASVDRDLLLLVRHIIKVRSTFERKIQLFRETLTNDEIDGGSIVDEVSHSIFTSMPSMLVDATFGIRQLSARALADDLEAKLGVQDAAASISILYEPEISRNSRPLAHQVNSTSSLTIGGASLVARETAAIDDSILFSTEFEGLNLTANAVGSHAWEGGEMDEMPSLRLLVVLRALYIRVPRDAIRVYEYIENWRTHTLPTYDTLLTELRQGLDDIHLVAIEQDKPPSTSFIELLSAKARLGLQVVVPVIGLEVQAIPTLRMGYYLSNVLLHANTEDGAKGGVALGAIDAGGSIGSQTIRFTPVAESQQQLDNLPPETSFDLPILRLKANLDGLPCRKVSLLGTIDLVTVTLTSAVLDNILTVQNRFGNDVDELLSAINTRRARLAASGEDVALQKPLARMAIQWDARIALQGIKIGVEGPQSTQWIEAELLEGFASSAIAESSSVLHWEASVQDLALSLSQRTTAQSSQSTSQDRRYRLAFFRLDLTVGNSIINLPDLPAASVYGNDQAPHLHIRFSRIHAVLQPTAVDALGDLIDHFEKELEIRRSANRQDVEALRDRVMHTLELTERPAKDQSTSWLATCVLSLEAHSMGLAIPLHDDGIPAPDKSRLRRGRTDQSRPAFLVTIPSLKFATQKGQVGYARVERLAFQFVSDFDQGRKEDYEADIHQSRNRILFPEMYCTIRCPEGGAIFADSTVSGIEIDMEPSMVAFAFSLIDVYNLSHERFAKFAPVAVSDDLPILPCDNSFVRNLQASFEFESGVIQMHSKRSAWHRKLNPSASSRHVRPGHHRQGRSLNDFSHFRSPFAKSPETDAEDQVDTFRLPGMSVWAEFKEGTTRNSSDLHVDISIHASSNVLYPTLLPFISGTASQFTARALQNEATPTSSTIPSLQTSPLAKNIHLPLSDTPALRQLRIGLSLKLDQSKLEISCLPAAEVTARLTWASGGVLVTMSPGVKELDFALTVDGVAAGLKHSFSPEDCLMAEAKGMSATVAYRGDDDKPGAISVAFDVPDLSAEMNFRHLQDFHCLKAVWIDRMDLGARAPSSVSAQKSASDDADRAPDVSIRTGPMISILALVKLQTVRFICDLGQAVGKSIFTAEAVNARLRWIPEESKCVSISVGSLALLAQGRMSGTASLQGIIFETRLREEALGAAMTMSDLLHISIGLGKMSANLKYEIHQILLLDADPLAVTVTDDWSRVIQGSAELELAFHVKMRSLNVIATVSTIPILLMVSRRIQALLIEKAAQADTTIQNAGLPARPAQALRGFNAVSAIASTLRDTSATEKTIRIINQLTIEAERFRISIFPEHFNDGEVFRADAGAIKAQLTRGIESSEMIGRDLELYLGSFSIRKVQHRKLPAAQEVSYTVVEWYELFRTSSEKNIFKVPTTQVSMQSEQAEGRVQIEHKFSMMFGGQVDIALNFALLKNLQALANSYQLQMDALSMSSTTALRTSAGTPQSDPSNLEAVKGSESILLPMLPLEQVTKGDRRALAFIAKEVNVEQPKLNLLGDATPPLEWLGLQRARFPGWIHTGVTIPLEELLLVLSSTYSTQLARQKVKSTIQGPDRANV